MSFNNNVVFDSSALLALLYQENGSDIVAEVMQEQGALINTINLSEVAAVLARDGLTQEDIRTSLVELKLDIAPLDTSVALKAGSFVTDTKQYGLSLGDRACLMFAENLKLPVYTTDKQWAQVQQFLSVPIKFVR